MFWKFISLNSHITKLLSNTLCIIWFTFVYLQVFGDKAFEKYGKGFISMHFSDQYVGAHKKKLVFKVALPDANHMADMTRLVALVPHYIDLIGRYKLSSQVGQKIIIFFPNRTWASSICPDILNRYLFNTGSQQDRRSPTEGCQRGIQRISKR